MVFGGVDYRNRIVLLYKIGKGFFYIFYFLFWDCKQTPCQAELARFMLGAGTMPVVTH
jgi:hypothetical protein